MVLNYIWVAFFVIAFVIAAVRLLFMGDMDVFPAIMNSTMDNARTAFCISIGLTGVLSLWMGIMKIGEKGGVVETLSRWLAPLFRRLFPDIPEGHPVTGHIFMNLCANMLGLDNAATPLGLKAMEGLQQINTDKSTASNPMIMFMVLNTSGLTLIPVSILVYRAQQGAAQPADVFVPILLATLASTFVGVAVTAMVQRINLLCRPVLVTVGVLATIVAGVIYAFVTIPQDVITTYSTTLANVVLLTIIVAFIMAGVRRKVNVYDAFIEGAKGGFETAVRVIPYLVAILVGVGVFRSSGAMGAVIDGLSWALQQCGVNADAVGALPTALMKPLSGSGARGMMVDAMSTYGPDSLAGRLACIFQGSTDTTFYILAVYFGSVGISRTRHAVACGLAADAAGILAAIAIAYAFFG